MRVLISCIDQYSSKIIQIFDFATLISFLLEIDKIAKEKGALILSHFRNSLKVEKHVRLAESYFHQETSQNRATSEEIEQEVDFICEEISLFSFYYQSFCFYIYSLIFKSTKKSITHSTDKEVQKLKRALDFDQIDELVNNYILLERFYLKNKLVKALETDNLNFVKAVETIYEKDDEESKKKKPASGREGSEGFRFDKASEVMDFVDEYSYILFTVAKRVNSLFNPFRDSIH